MMCVLGRAPQGSSNRERTGLSRSLLTATTRHQLWGSDYSERSDVNRSIPAEKCSDRTLSNGMPYFFRIEGEIRVILCLKKASQIWELPGKNPWRREGEYGGVVSVSSNSANKETTVYLEPGAQTVFRVPEVCNTCRYIQMLATI